MSKVSQPSEKVLYSGEVNYCAKNPADLKKKPKLKPIFFSLTASHITLAKLKNKVP
jgi:hypothetical protein